MSNYFVKRKRENQSAIGLVQTVASVEGREIVSPVGRYSKYVHRGVVSSEVTVYRDTGD